MNDVARYKKQGIDLADFICDKFRSYAKMYPNVKFVFNSLLNVEIHNGQWCNKAIDIVNEAVFKLSLKCDNLWFFDSHCALKFTPLDFDVLEPRSGIHISYKTKLFLADLIVNCLTLMLTGNSQCRDVWPMRPSFGCYL